MNLGLQYPELRFQLGQLLSARRKNLGPPLLMGTKGLRGAQRLGHLTASAEGQGMGDLLSSPPLNVIWLGAPLQGGLAAPMHWEVSLVVCWACAWRTDTQNFSSSPPIFLFSEENRLSRLLSTSRLSGTCIRLRLHRKHKQTLLIYTLRGRRETFPFDLPFVTQMLFSLSQLVGESCWTGAVELLHKASWSCMWTEHQVDGCAQRCSYHESFITPAKALGTTFTNVKDNLTLGILLSLRLHILQGEKIPLGLFVGLTLSNLHFYCRDSLIFSFSCKQRITNSTLSFYSSFYIVHPTISKYLWVLKKCWKRKLSPKTGAAYLYFPVYPVVQLPLKYLNHTAWL